jgi:hypothetical protein
MCTNTTLEISWFNYSSTTHLYSTTKIKIEDLKREIKGRVKGF